MFGLFGVMPEGSSQPQQKRETMPIEIKIRFIEWFSRECIFLKHQIKITHEKSDKITFYRGELSEKQAFIFIFLQLLHEAALSIKAAFGHFFFYTQHLCDIIEVDHNPQPERRGGTREVMNKISDE